MALAIRTHRRAPSSKWDGHDRPRHGANKGTVGTNKAWHEGMIRRRDGGMEVPKVGVKGCKARWRREQGMVPRYEDGNMLRCEGMRRRKG
ncbi:hypothetical protein E2562_003148 [Oryza meyeriana var. granulata]|uniref:Uncharacterized protein n=1 Tax=Oryza meyeriana var. granulata TaxID=110450 RepID=A0A6G1E8C5_9ORYZ|nr:hypothetical protein E2562_003148 [Oryza meyeriana var. granulata]